MCWGWGGSFDGVVGKGAGGEDAMICRETLLILFPAFFEPLLKCGNLDPQIYSLSLADRESDEEGEYDCHYPEGEW